MKKIKIAVLAAVIVVAVLIIISRLVPINLFQGDIAQTISTTKDTQIDSSVEKIDTTIIPEKLLEPIEKSEEPLIINTELKPIEVVMPTPPKISFAYLDRLDANHPSIYGSFSTLSQQQFGLIFRLRNSGSSSAFLKSFNTTHTFSNLNCNEDKGFCRLLATSGGTIVRLNYDSSGNYVNFTQIGRDSLPSTGVDGNFSEPELSNKAPLEIKGNSDAVFAVYKDMTGYSWFSNYNDVQAQAILLTATLNVTDAKNNSVGSMYADSDSATPGIITYR